MSGIIIISDIILISAALIWLVAACITDLRKREVPNWLSFSLIGIALAIRGIASLLTGQLWYFLYALIALAIFFAIANAFYYGKVFGGGDAKLLMALAPALATTPLFARFFLSSFPEPFLLTFVINMLVLGFIYGIVFSIIAAVKNRKTVSVQFKKNNKKARWLRLCCWIAAAVALAAVFFTADILKPLILVLFVVLFIAPFLYTFIKAVEDSSLVKKIKPGQLAEGDWLVHSVRVKNKLIKPNVHGLSAAEISLLKKADKYVLIKAGLPFVPIFLAALICSLLLGDLLLLLILSFV